MVTLRHFRLEDAETLRRGQYTQMGLDEIKSMIGDWETLSFGGRRFEMFAVDEDGRAVGSASLYEHSPSVVSAGVEIFEEERQKGCAAAALRLLIEAAAEKGYRIMQDQVRADNSASIHLHKTCGFETDGYVYQNKKGQDVILFLRAL